MDYATGEDIARMFTCMFVVFALMAAYAWIGLYRLWKRNFHDKSISSINQIINLLAWLLLVAATMFSSIVIFWLFPPLMITP